MPARILSGTEPAETLLTLLKPQAEVLKPTLVIVQVGEHPETDAYVRAKITAGKRIGIHCDHRRLPLRTTLGELLALIDTLNHDGGVSGYILQLPLPDHLWNDFANIARAIDPAKDVDGATARNLDLPPATPAGIILLLEYYGIAIAGKRAVIVGRSNLVGKPLALMLLNRDATVTVCHSKTPDLAAHTCEADLLVSAVGHPKLITASMVKPGAVVIDVGITKTHATSSRLRSRATDGQAGQAELVGDVDFDRVKEVASAITPVPGGVGPMTVASLLRNVIRAKERQMQR